MSDETREANRYKSKHFRDVQAWSWGPFFFAKSDFADSVTVQLGMCIWRYGVSITLTESWN